MYVYIKFYDVAYSYLFALICACTVIMLLFYTCLSKKKPYRAYVISCLLYSTQNKSSMSMSMSMSI